eukprot:1347446-Rhodomonas_salina.1
MCIRDSSLPHSLTLSLSPFLARSFARSRRAGCAQAPPVQCAALLSPPLPPTSTRSASPVA